MRLHRSWITGGSRCDDEHVDPGAPQIQVQLLTGSVTLRNREHLSESLFPHLPKGMKSLHQKADMRTQSINIQKRCEGWKAVQ